MRSSRSWRCSAFRSRRRAAARMLERHRRQARQGREASQCRSLADLHGRGRCGAAAHDRSQRRPTSRKDRSSPSRRSARNWSTSRSSREKCAASIRRGCSSLPTSSAFRRTGSRTGSCILEDDAPLGADFIELMRLNDDVIDVEITANRVDAMCLIGIARELSVAFKQPLHVPDRKSSTTPATRTM